MRISHLEAKYGIEEIEDVLEPSEFETGLIQEPTPDSSHIDDAIVLRDNLGAIAEQAEEHPEVALEHYHWSVKQILGTKSVPMPRKLGLENFGDTARDRRSFIREIRSLENHLDSNIQISLEAYSEAIDKQLKTAINENGKIHKNLKEKIRHHSEYPVLISNKKALSVFIRDNQLLTQSSSVKTAAEDSLDSTYKIIRNYIRKNKLSSGGKYEVDLLMNYKLIINHDEVMLEQSEFDVETVITKATKDKSISEMIKGGLFIGGAYLTAIPAGVLAMLGAVTLPAFGVMTATALLGYGIFKSIKGLFSLISHKEVAETIAKNRYKFFYECAEVIAEQSEKITITLELNQQLKEKDLEQSVKMQRILLNSVKYINELQHAVVTIYDDSKQIKS